MLGGPAAPRRRTPQPPAQLVVPASPGAHSAGAIDTGERSGPVPPPSCGMADRSRSAAAADAPDSGGRRITRPHLRSAHSLLLDVQVQRVAPPLTVILDVLHLIGLPGAEFEIVRNNPC